MCPLPFYLVILHTYTNFQGNLPNSQHKEKDEGMDRGTRADITFERLSSIFVSFQINFISAIPLVGAKKKEEKKT